MSENPFDFPSAFWFGWSVCFAIFWVIFAVCVWQVVLAHALPTIYVVIVLGMLGLAVAFCGNAIQERRFQLKHRHKQ